MKEATTPTKPPDVEEGREKPIQTESLSSSCCPILLLERRWILFVFAFVSTSLVSGVVYGWPALRRQLIQEEDTTLTEAQLGAIYTVGTWSVQGGRFFTGLARDQLGTRRVACFSLLCTVAGAIGIGLASANNAIALAISLFCISLGAGVQLVMQPVGSLFPQFSNSIISSLSGSFQISGLVFLALTSLPLSRQQAFLVYAAVVALLLVMAWILLPKGASFLPAAYVDDNDDDDEENSGISLDKVVTTEEEEEITEEHPSPSSQHLADLEKLKVQPTAIEKEDPPPPPPPPPPPSPARQLTKLQQFISAEYVGLLLWFSIALVPMQYYVGTIGYQLEQKGDEDGFYTNLFSIIYAASAVVGPPGGYMADQWGLGLTQGIATILVALSFFILGSDDVGGGGGLQVQVIGLVCYSIGRMLIFGMFFSNVGQRFGYVHFGSLSGVGLLISAIASLLQYPMIAAATEEDNMTKARIVNFASGSVLLALIPYCVWLAITERKVESARSWMS